LKPSHFGDGDFVNDEASDTNNGDEASEAFGIVQGDDDIDDLESGNASHEDQDSDDEEDIHIDLDTQATSYQPPLSTRKFDEPSRFPSLKVTGGFQWSADAQAEDHVSDMSSGEDETEERPGRKKKRRRKEIEQDLTADMQTKTPDSNADFERLLLGSPNSSYLWIQYMSFQLQLAEVEKAREVSRRALKTIHFREEQEKLNVWIALLNLECVYGTDETLEKAFKEASRANDSKTVHLQLATIFNQAGKPDVRRTNYVLLMTHPFFRERKNSINVPVRSSARVPKFGHSSVNTTHGERTWRRPGSYFLAVCRAWISGNVSHSDPQLYASR
jgi:rRNA biogenesis protein RRP5